MNTLPKAFTDRIINDWAHESENLLQAISHPPATSVRIHPIKTNKISSWSSIPWCEYGYILLQRPSFAFDPYWHAGAYYVQESSSMFLQKVWSAIPRNDSPLRILDICAAPGGKSTHLLSLMKPQDFLICNEVIHSRAQVLSENITKWGYPNVMLTQSDTQKFALLKEYFDVILVDTPCSGEGLFRRDNNAMKEWSVDNCNKCVSRQKRILAHAWEALKPGAYLIYSTCTFNPQENENNIQWLIDEYNATCIPINYNSSEITIIDKYEVIGYQFLPHRTKGEGFFISLIQKKGIKIENEYNQLSITKNMPASVMLATIHSEHQEYFYFKNKIHLINVFLSKEMIYLQRYLHIIQVGTAIAAMRGEKIILEHALAMSIYLNKNNFSQIKLTLEQSLEYLRKNELDIDMSSYPKGWHLVVYDDTPLGWCKVLDHRINNYYPTAWRLRK